MDPGKTRPLPCFLLCIQPAGQKKSEANPIPCSNWASKDTSQEEDSSKNTTEGTGELRYVPNLQLQGQLRKQRQEGLQLGPHQGKVAPYRALHPPGFCDVQLAAPQLTLQQHGLNRADLGISRFPSVGSLGAFQSGLETGKGK